MRVQASFLLALTLGLVQIPALAQNLNWKITKTAWTAADETNYSNFIAALGMSGCNSMSACLTSTANPYRKTDTGKYAFPQDCAKMPYTFRAYFAWKNGLPFSYVNGLSPNDPNTSDNRYTPDGNSITSRQAIIEVKGSGYQDQGGFFFGFGSSSVVGQDEQGPQAITQMLGQVDTATFRVDPTDDANVPAFSDFYSAAINRQAIHPGTMIYDPAGHVAIVYSITDDGQILYIDAHPDTSITHGTYGNQFARSRPAQGAGFKNFRPLQLVGAVQGPNGDWVGGKIQGTLNKNLPEFGLEQYYGTNPDPGGDWSKGIFEFKGTTQNYYDYVRLSMASPDFKYNPVTELTNMMTTACQNVQARINSVQEGIAAGLNLQPHPANLPQNIYGADGDWENYATPDSDARLKDSFATMLTQIQKLVALYKAGSSIVSYPGKNLGADLRAAYTQTSASAACTISYTLSNGSPQKLGYEDIVSRLFKISFDPYHCVELRWGADVGSNEMASCPADADKMAWYLGEQWLRNDTDRDDTVQMGFTVDQLNAHAPGSGIATPPNVDLKGYLNTL